MEKRIKNNGNIISIVIEQGIYDGENPFLHKTNRYYKNSSECCLNCLTACNRVDKGIDNWCTSYLKKEKQEPVKKLVPNKK